MNFDRNPSWDFSRHSSIDSFGNFEKNLIQILPCVYIENLPWICFFTKYYKKIVENSCSNSFFQGSRKKFLRGLFPTFLLKFLHDVFQGLKYLYLYIKDFLRYFSYVFLVILKTFLRGFFEKFIQGYFNKIFSRLQEKFPHGFHQKFLKRFHQKFLHGSINFIRIFSMISIRNFHRVPFRNFSVDSSRY